MQPAPRSLSLFRFFLLNSTTGSQFQQRHPVPRRRAAYQPWVGTCPSCKVGSSPTVCLAPAHESNHPPSSSSHSHRRLSFCSPALFPTFFFRRALRSFRLHVVFTCCFSRTASFTYYELHVVAGSLRATIDQKHARLRKTRTLLPNSAIPRAMDPSPSKRRRLTPYSPQPSGGPPTLSGYVDDPLRRNHVVDEHETEDQKRQLAQQFYNKFRELEERIKEQKTMSEQLQLHDATDDQAGYLRPPSPSQATTASMSRGTSYTGSIVHGLEEVDLGDGQQGGTKKRKTRGGRTGPLDELSKARAAFMRLSKKTCVDCRSRRVRVRLFPTACHIVSSLTPVLL